MAFIQTNDEDYVLETIETLEHLTESNNLKDEELDVIGELLSNLYGAVEVHKAVKSGESSKQAHEWLHEARDGFDRSTK